MHLASADPQVALTYAEQSINLANELEMKLEEGMSRRVLGQVLLATGQSEPALVAFEQSLSLLGGDPYEVARTKTAWGRFLASTSGPDKERGLSLLQEARATFQELGAKRDLAEVDEILEA
jgi:hypothetical protein